MRRLMLMAAFALTLMAATCSNNAQQVVDMVKANCGILVSVADVAGALSAANPAVVGVAAVAHAICQQYQAAAKPGADAGTFVLVQQQDQPKDDNKDCVAVVNGVCIHKEKDK